MAIRTQYTQNGHTPKNENVYKGDLHADSVGIAHTKYKKVKWQNAPKSQKKTVLKRRFARMVQPCRCKSFFLNVNMSGQEHQKLAKSARLEDRLYTHELQTWLRTFSKEIQCRAKKTPKRARDSHAKRTDLPANHVSRAAQLPVRNAETSTSKEICIQGAPTTQ